ncbi:lysosomal-trafficking regulator isoform X2 [Paramormyrops kingsleyae]|uniref:lysosomal-trafficking regulator isoform X2 n=1 Tax=Paramormyrops kingsleyae TaxID=1676925 RepID=UPI003B9709CF
MDAYPSVRALISPSADALLWRLPLATGLDMTGASNALARDFLTDVHQLCSEVARLAEEDEAEGEDSDVHMVALWSYLLQGRGFLLLRTLDLVIDQDLSCREELLTLLVSLLPLVWRIPVLEGMPQGFPLSSILEYSSSGGYSTLLRSGKGKVVSEEHNSGRLPSSRRKSRYHRCSARLASPTQVSTSDSDSISSSQTLGSGGKYSHPSGHVSRVTCFQEPLESLQPKSSAKETTSTLDAVQPGRQLLGHHYLSSEIPKDNANIPAFSSVAKSPFDLCQVLLSLLGKVYKFGTSFKHTPSVMVTLVPTLIEMLIEFGHKLPGVGREVAQGWTEEPIALVQRMLLRAILHLMIIDIAQREAMSDHLFRNFTCLLQATLKIHSCMKKVDPTSPSPDFSRYRHRVLLLSELLEGLLHVLLGYLQASPSNPAIFSKVLELLHEFVESQGLRLLEASALQLESFAGEDSATSEKALEQVRDLVGVLLRVIAAVKKAASEQLHQSTCHRRRHRRCEYTRLYHHHNITGLPGLALGHDDCRDLFGQKFVQDGDALHPGPGCCVAACAHQCLRLLEIFPSTNAVCLQIMTGLQAAGVCCCMDPRSVLGPLLHAFQAPGLQPYQSHVLNILSHLLLEQLGGGQLSKTGRQASCSICTLDDRQLLLMEKIMQGICASGLHIPTDIPEGIRARDVLRRWDALEAYRDLVFNKDRQQGPLIAGHVCSLLLQGHSLVQGLLYTHVFSPVLQRGVGLANYARELCISPAGDQSHSFHCQGLSVEVLSVFLQALPSLLKHRVIQNLFLSSNGLHHLTELIHLDPVRTSTLRVFETLILRIGNQQANPVSGMRLETEEVASFHSRKEDMQGLKLGKAHHNGRAESDAWMNDAHLSASSLFLRMAFLCVSKEADSDRDSANDSEDTSGYDSTASEPLGGRLPCLPPDGVTLPAKGQLWRVADVWSACYWIYRSSHTFQKQLFKLGGFDICSRLMTLVIQKLASKTKDGRGKKKKDAKGKQSPGQQDSHDPDPGPGSNQASPSGEQAESKCQEQVRKLEEEWPFQCLRLLEALLAICLQGAGSTLQKVDLEPSFQLQSKEETLRDLQEQLSHSGLVASDLAIPLFDCLLRVALAEGSPSPDVAMGKAERKLQSHRGAAAPDGYQSEEASDSQDPPDQVTAEEGYEGDAESHAEDSSTWDQAAGADAGSSEDGSSSGPCELRNPEVCGLQLALLASGSPDLGVLTHVLRGVLQALRGNPRNVTLLYRQGAVKTLLNGFQHILSMADPSYEECQTVLVELLVAMASTSITQEELVLLVRLFLEKTPPVDVLLGGFLRVVKANVDPEPLCFLTFPLAAEGSPGLMSQSLGPRDSTRRGLLPLGCLGADGESPGRFGASPWHMAPIHLQLMGQNCWPHLADGFSVSLWLRTWCDTKGRSPGKSESHVKKTGVPQDITVDMRGKNLPGSVQLSPQSTNEHLAKDGLLHIFSMGSKALMLQVWANPATGAFSFRVCVDPSDELKVGLLAKAESQGGLLTPGQWEHIALTYTQKPEGKRNAHGRLALWICGVRRYDVSLDYPLPRKPSLSTDGNKTYCMLGHCHPTVEDQCGTGRTWDFGSLLLFNGSRIESEEAFYLYASGPDFTSIMPCKYGKPEPRLTKYASEEALQADSRVLGLLTKGSQVDTAPLAESLAVVYTASRPGSYAIYEPVIRLKGQPKVVASPRPFSTKDVQSPLLEAQAIRALCPTEPQRLQSVLHRIGGTGAFVFLFAKTVELSDREETQALALKVLLSLIRQNQHRVAEMERCHGYSLVRQVLVKPKCIVGYHMLQTLLDGCCSRPILSQGVDGRFHLDRESTAVVQDLHLLSSLLLDWKVWSKAQAGVWATLLQAMEVLIHARHPQQMYNIQQLLKARIVQRILLTCQLLQDEHLAPIPENVCGSFVKIIQEVLGSPPDLELLRIVYGFLLAAHPPADAYVCHAPSAFCFSLHIDGKVYQEKVQSIMFQRQFSDGARSATGSLSPTGFAGGPLGDYFGDCQTSGPHHQDRSPSPSPCPSPGAEDKVAPPDLEPVPNSRDAEQDPAAGGLLLSSCESAVTVVDCHVSLPETGRREDPEADWEGRDTGVGGAAEALLRPDSLLGVRPIPKCSRSGFAGLDLAFPAQNIAAGQWPGAADRSALRDDATAYSVSAETACNEADSANNRPSAEDRLAMVCCGLYELLRGVLLTLPDIMLEKVVNGLIQPEALIVLVNHPSALVQQAVIKLLDAYFSRAFQEQKERFLKNHGFSLLANQLYLRPGSQGLLECCLEMVMGCPVGLEEELDPEALEKVGPFQKRCVISLLGLIESSLGDSGLVHAALCTLLQLLNACPKLTDILLDHGLLCVLLNTLAALNGLESGIPLDDHKLLVCDIQQLLVYITIHSCSSSGSQYFHIIEDLVTLLGHLQTSTIPRTKEMAVILQFQILQSAIRLIRTTADRDPAKASCLGARPAIQQHTIQQRPRSFAARRRLSLAPLELLTRMRSVASEELSHMIQRRMSQESPVHATEAEFSQRLQRLLLLAVNLLIYQGVRQDLFDLLNIPDSPVPQHAPSDSTEPGAPWTLGIMGSFQKEIFELMMEGLRTGLGGSGRGGAPRQQWARILWSCRDTFRAQFVRLLAHALNPARPLVERKRALGFVYESGHPDVLREAVSLSPELALYLCEMLHHHRDSLTQEDQAAVSNLLVSPKYSVPPGTGSETDLSVAIREDLLRFELEKKASRVAWEKKTESAQRSLMQRLDTKLKEISRVAADVTQAVSQQQSAERKKVMQHIRSLCKLSLTASRHWQWLVQQLTHDRAVWYDPASYPTSWQLDPTEGPNRERRRLQSCYMTVPNKYLLKERRKCEDPVRPPLSFLFEDRTHSYVSSTVKDKATSEPTRSTMKCFSVAPSRETPGDLLLGKSGMYFVEDHATDAPDSHMSECEEHCCESCQSPHGETEPASFSWTYEEIKEVHKRWWQLRDNALEIFLTNGRTLLLAFDNTKARDSMYHNILTSDLPNLLEHGNITALTQLWGSGLISNFEYLTHLNKHAGRSFNDLMQYPVFPFILSDYTSMTLDLQDPSIYRNLGKPIAVQSKEKEDRYIENYKYLEEEFVKGVRDDDPVPPVQPYHYGSHYSNSGTVLHFLVRMPPFTKMFLAYQDQSFDIPDRTFHSMNTTWRLSSYESMTDVKELIPEFFYLPEFLVNREGFDFGVRQNSERVNHVNLPPWARNDPRLFVLIHRQALESDQVSQTLCQWIDLVFGFKQKGKAAVQAVNVFHPATYFGMDVSAVEDPVQRRALETMIKTYGQTPRQLFSTSHVSRDGELPAAMGLLVHLAFRENREHGKEPACPSPLPWIKGLKWGEYVGSPSAPDPVVCFSQPHGECFGSLLALPTRAVCGLSRKFCLMMIYSKEQGVRSMRSTDIRWSAILSWGYADHMLRLKSRQSEPPVSFLQCSPLYQVTSCAWVPDSCQLFTGTKCGAITAYGSRFSYSTPLEVEVESQVQLYGHTEEVTGLFVCKPFSILISVSNDGTCILWDLNRLCYVQSLTGHKSPVVAVSASETTGDIATACNSVGGGSDLRLWTVNGDLIGHVHCREIICSMAFSNQPEGVSVNVIAGGLENGVVRLWSTWDLKPVREITFPKSSKPIVSLTFSCDGHHLYTASSEGTVMAWCRRDQQRLKLPMFYSFLSSYAAG